MNGGRNLKAWLFTSIFLLGMAGLAQARTITVGPGPGYDFNSIQPAIDDSNDGDTIIVQPGLYQELVEYHGKNITLTSTNPGDFNVVAATIIDYSVVFVGTEDANCILTGFKINYRISGYGTHATISHCLLVGNRVSRATVISNCDGTITNCIVANNLPAGDWLGPAISGCHGLIKNCTVVKNLETGIEVMGGGTTTIENCIIYGNVTQIRNAGTINILYSNIVGYISDDGIVNWGPGNIVADPCFVRVREPFYTFDNDYHLKSQAGRWDPNGKGWVQDDVTSPCIDAGNPMNPIGFEPFPNGGRVNMGAYGGTAEASKSYFGKPVCEIIVAGDVTGDCIVNYLDFRLMALHWLECIEPNQGQYLVEDDTEDSYSCEGDFDVSYPCSNAVDEDWDTYALPADGGATSYIYENYIIPTGISMAEFTIKYRQTAAVTPGLCTNVTDYWDGSTWKELNCTALTTQISTLTVRIPDDALSRSTLQLRTPTRKSLGIPGSGSGMYYEGKVIWYLLPVCEIIAGDVNGDCIVNYLDFRIMALNWLRDENQ